MFVDKSFWRNIALFTEIGLTMICCILVGYFLGDFAGRFVGARLILAVLGSFIGVIAGFYSVYKLIERGMGNTER